MVFQLDMRMNRFLSFLFITIFMLLFSVFYFKEKTTYLSLISVAFCVLGISLISMNGLTMSKLLEFDFYLTLIFAISALGACFHFVSQKILIEKMNATDMNLSIFLWCSLVTTVPVPSQFQLQGEFNAISVLSLTGLGFITGISFLIYAKALKQVSFMVASILGNASIIFTLFWSWLFFKEPITIYIVIGSLLFLVGMFVLALPGARVSKPKQIANVS